MKRKPVEKKAGRPPKSEVAPGVFKRGSVYWLRYSIGGEQIRVSLETDNPTEAIRRAEERRGRKVSSKKTGRIIGGKTPLDRAAEKYVEARIAAGKFTGKSDVTATRAIKHYAESMGVNYPEEITTESLLDYYRKTQKALAEGTAQSYVARVSTFAKWYGLRAKCPEFVSETPAREIVVTKEVAAQLMVKARSKELKFILFCGFHAGMRRAEISMARPAWFDLQRRVIRIPAKDPVSGFATKSKRARTIPLTPPFFEFIETNFPEWKTQPWCIRPDKSMGKAIYRYDFRAMFERFAAKHCPELTPHVMRHSYASHLANGGMGAAQLSAWTGDRIETLERHYLHLDADAEKAHLALSAEIFAELLDPDRNDQLPETISRDMYIPEEI